MPNSPIDNYAKCLNKLINENNFSKRSLSIKSGVSRACIDNYLDGLFLPRYDALARIADVFEVNTDYMVGLTVDDFNIYKTSVQYYEIPKLFCTRLIDFMTLFGYSQGALSRKLNMQQATVSKWTRMETMPEVIVMIKLSNIFNCSVDYLIGRERIEK